MHANLRDRCFPERPLGITKNDSSRCKADSSDLMERAHNNKPKKRWIAMTKKTNTAATSRLIQPIVKRLSNRDGDFLCEIMGRREFPFATKRLLRPSELASRLAIKHLSFKAEQELKSGLEHRRKQLVQTTKRIRSAIPPKQLPTMMAGSVLNQRMGGRREYRTVVGPTEQHGSIVPLSFTRWSPYQPYGWTDEGGLESGFIRARQFSYSDNFDTLSDESEATGWTRFSYTMQGDTIGLWMYQTNDTPWYDEIRGESRETSYRVFFVRYDLPPPVRSCTMYYRIALFAHVPYFVNSESSWMRFSIGHAVTSLGAYPTMDELWPSSKSILRGRDVELVRTGEEFAGTWVHRFDDPITWRQTDGPIDQPTDLHVYPAGAKSTLWVALFVGLSVQDGWGLVGNVTGPILRPQMVPGTIVIGSDENVVLVPGRGHPHYEGFEPGVYVEYLAA